jgi:hypothetical protein
VSVLIGPTEKMGVGTNIRERAVALHHVDCAWRPADNEHFVVGTRLTQSCVRAGWFAVLACGRGSTTPLGRPPVELTRGEFDLLTALAQEPGTVRAREDLGRRVWAGRP